MLEKKFKRGIAMIELIFAIVIIAIVLLSAPMLINQSINSSFVALQQEAIAAAASQTSILLSKPWDENDASTAGDASAIITLTNANPASEINGLVGLVGRTGGRLISLGGANPVINISTNLGKDINETEANASLSYDDIDDYNGFRMGISVFHGETTSAETGEYVDVNLSILNTITFANDRPSGGWNTATIDAGNLIYTNQSLGGIPNLTHSHIKFVNVNLTSTNTDGVAELLEKDITFNSFSCNIGTYLTGEQQY